MAQVLPRSPSFVSLSTALPDSPDLDDALLTPKVRFEQECVLIPDVVPFSRLPRLVTKSYSLPLWKRKRSPSVVSEPEEELPEDQVVFKVSVPSITTKARSPSREAAARPLVSCLVHNPDPSSFVPTSPPRPIGRLRRGSLPVPVPEEAETVPLRACCAQCYHSIDKCMKEGDHWQVHFSRGALRRRKSVSDAHTPSRARHCVREAMPGFDAIVAVDEVDQRRKSSELESLTAFAIEMPANACMSSSPGPEEIPLRRALSLPDSTAHPNRAKPMPDLHPRALSPAIIEEDEFRPSPRRTPIPSPLCSSTNLPLTRVLVAPQAEKAVAIPVPVARSSSPENVFESLASVLSASPVALTPPTIPGPVQEKADCTSYFPAPYASAHERADSPDSPLSSPSSSPHIPHARSTSTLESSGARRKPRMALPGSIVRASAQMLKGLSGMGGMPV